LVEQEGKAELSVKAMMATIRKDQLRGRRKLKRDQ
jgi:hypothetical protein